MSLKVAAKAFVVDGLTKTIIAVVVKTNTKLLLIVLLLLEEEKEVICIFSTPLGLS
jgi:hypothetical protein